MFLRLITSTPLGSVALITDKDVSELTWDQQQSHAEVVTLETEKLLKQNNLELKDIDLFACGTGPGSFTGIRVALELC